MERTKDETHVKLLKSLVAEVVDIFANVNVNRFFFFYARLTIRVICMLRNSRVRFVKTNPQFYEELQIMLYT